MLSARSSDSTSTVHAKLMCEDWFPIGSFLLLVPVRVTVSTSNSIAFSHR